MCHLPRITSSSLYHTSLWSTSPGLQPTFLYNYSFSNWLLAGAGWGQWPYLAPAALHTSCLLKVYGLLRTCCCTRQPLKRDVSLDQRQIQGSRYTTASFGAQTDPFWGTFYRYKAPQMNLTLSVHSSDQLGETHLGWPSPPSRFYFPGPAPVLRNHFPSQVSSLLPMEKGRPRHPASSELNLTSGLTASACFFFNNFKVCFQKKTPL